MLTSISIRNYALIDHLDVDFSEGLSTVTGETGAGKSILLGGLALVLGKRADLKSLQDKKKKCVIEAVFEIAAYELQSYFASIDIDYEPQTIIRRELLTSGKSRAFINDSPVTLGTLSELGGRLIDVHSQHQTLQLSDTGFQFKVVDALAGNEKLLKSYAEQLTLYKKSQEALKKMMWLQSESHKEEAYDTFLLEELKTAALRQGEQEELEEDIEKLNHVAEIKQQFAMAEELMNAEQYGLLTLTHTLQSCLAKTTAFSKEYKSFAQRSESICIEMNDLCREIENANQYVEFAPQRLTELNNRLQTIYDLLKKHNVLNVRALLEKQALLEKKVTETESLEESIKEKEKEITIVKTALNQYAEKIHANRKKAIPQLISRLKELLGKLGMPEVRFRIDLTPVNQYLSNGKDELAFLFSANKGIAFESLKKAASGGELSRIMLAIKSILSQNIKLPTIIFDEIDTGISGDISDKMGIAMKQMGKNMQVIAITHLPQIAAKGNRHYKVYKEVEAGHTATYIKELSGEQRVLEIAEMLGSKKRSASAITHAKELLG